MTVGATLKTLAGKALKPVRAGDRKLAGNKDAAIDRRPITLSTTSYTPGGPIPARYSSCDGNSVSPALIWDDVPAGTVEFALICEDPDAPTPQPFVHWTMYRIPAEMRALPEGMAPSAVTPHGARQGRSSAKKIGYLGPAPPPGHGVHHYHFQLFALDTHLSLDGDVDRDALVKAMDGHVLAMGELVGTYERK
jgi:Raf kinase inhibitor-like YbhB/YbcL family protein